MPIRIGWHPATEADLRKLDPVVRKRIVNAVERLGDIDDPRQRLVAYVESLRGYWKLRVGDYRVVCDLQRAADDQLVLVIYVVHRSQAYLAQSLRTIHRRSED